jgi:hypothetical protein
MREDLLTRIIFCVKFLLLLQKKKKIVTNSIIGGGGRGSIKFGKLKKYICLNLQFLKYMVQVGSKKIKNIMTLFIFFLQYF